MSDSTADEPATDPPYQSLYRRYRPQRFEDVLGQEHVTRALRNSVRTGRIAHAYLFSGPRGTGKTSTARILAMALNCEDPADGEPDGTCASCVDIRRGSSMDVQELDAASNRRIDEMRDLLSRVALGTRGRWKVYIIDEVHQLTGDAASALLKTLEEPPAHVVFVLATTDPQKVLDTIRSRTISFDFHLLPADVLSHLLHDINERARLGVPPAALDQVVRLGHGSARDALTALDQVAAGGLGEDPAHVVSQIVDALAERDTGLALTAVAEGVATGRDPRRLAADLLDHLRNGFLAIMSRGLVLLPEEVVTELGEQANRLGAPALVRAMEVIGDALAEMRDSVDPRITLEVALVRLTRPDADTSPAALLERIERLERHERVGRLADPTVPHPPSPPSGPPSTAARTGGTPAAPGPRPAGPAAPDASPSVAPGSRPPAPATPAPVLPTQPSGRAASARASLRSPPPATGPSAPRASSHPSGPVLPPPPPAVSSSPARADRSAPPPAPATHLPSRDELTKAWGDGVLGNLSARAKVYLGAGRFVRVDVDGAVFAVPTKQVLAQGRELQPEAEAALSARFGLRVPLKLVVESEVAAITGSGGSPRSPGPDPEPDEVIDRAELQRLPDADVAVTSPEQRLLDMFPGAEEVSP